MENLKWNLKHYLGLHGKKRFIKSFLRVSHNLFLYTKTAIINSHIPRRLFQSLTQQTTVWLKQVPKLPGIIHISKHTTETDQHRTTQV